MPSLRPQDFRGTNYTPSISRGFVTNLGLLPWVAAPGTSEPTRLGGFFLPSHCNQEMAAIAGIRLNTIRMIGSFYAWVCNRKLYMQSLSYLAAACIRNNIRITYVFWNTTLWGDPSYHPHSGLVADILLRGYVGGNNRKLLADIFDSARRWSRGNLPASAHFEENLTQYTEPGPDAHLWDSHQLGPGFDRWHPVFRSLVLGYLEDVCRFFADAIGGGALASFDLYNEPDTAWESTVGQFPLRIQHVERFIYITYKKVRTIVPDALCTIGWAGLTSRTAGNHNARIEALGVHQDYYSFHSYPEPGDMWWVVAHIHQLLPRLGARVPIVCSEFWDSRYRGSLSEYCTALRSAGFGGQMWGFLQHNAYRGSADYDGVLVPTPAQLLFPGSPIDFTVADGGDLQAAIEWSGA